MPGASWRGNILAAHVFRPLCRRAATTSGRATHIIATTCPDELGIDIQSATEASLKVVLAEVYRCLPCQAFFSAVYFNWLSHQPGAVGLTIVKPEITEDGTMV
jgi:hypothetical protein